MFPHLRIPTLALPWLTVHAHTGFINDGSVSLGLSTEGSPSRVYKPTVAFKPKGISSDHGPFGPSQPCRGGMAFKERRMAGKTRHSCFGSPTLAPVSAEWLLTKRSCFGFFCSESFSKPRTRNRRIFSRVFGEGGNM